MSELLWDGTLSHLLAGPGLPLAEKVLRPVVVYAALVVLLRVFGKRELAQLNPFDLVVLLSLSNTVQNAIIGEDNSVSSAQSRCSPPTTWSCASCSSTGGSTNCSKASRRHSSRTARSATKDSRASF